ncbi:MAG: hypothetical protein H0W02_04470 [Ktedonobacteraceae bacterium]|nr:hypothetical protein [Ktedonobacteraceae bacterium]
MRIEMCVSLASVATSYNNSRAESRGADRLRVTAEQVGHCGAFIKEQSGEEQWPHSRFQTFATEPEMSQQAFDAWMEHVNGYIAAQTHLPLLELDPAQR